MADNKQFTVSTSLISMFDETGSQLRLAGLESGMSIAIWSPQVNPDGKTTYPQEMRFTTMMSTDTVASLNWLIRNRIVPDWEAGKDFKYGVPCNRSMTAVIDIIGSGGEIYLRMSRDIDENRQAKNVHQFKFTNTNILLNYDPQSGAFDIDKVPAQFTMFTEVIAAYNAVTYSAGHGSRVANKFTISSMYNYLQAIASNLGVVADTGYRRNPPLTGGNTVNNGNSYYGANPQTSGYKGQMQEGASIYEIVG